MIVLNTPADVRELLTRFGGFSDALLVAVHLSLPRASAERFALLTLLAQELPESAGGWQTVVLRIDGLRGYRLSEGPDTYLVLSDGLDFRRVGDGRCVLDLSPGQTTQIGNGTGLGQFVEGLKCSYEVSTIAP